MSFSHLSPVARPKLLDVVKAIPGSRPASDGSAFAARDQTPYCTARTTESLAAIGRWLARNPGSVPVFWLPDYFCNDALSLLRAEGVQFVFYALADTLDPDWTHLPTEERCSVFVLVHFFGAASDVDGAWQFCQRRGAILVEDCAHVLGPTETIGTRGDFVCFSPHKTMPVSPVGVMLARWNQIETKIQSDGPPRLRFEKELATARRSDDQDVVRAIRSVVAGAVPGAIRRLLRSRATIVTPAVLPVAYRRTDPSPLPSRFALRLLDRHTREMEFASLRRDDKDAVIRSCAASIAADAGVVPQRKRDAGDGAPFSVGLHFDDVGRADTAWRQLSALGWSPSGWFDLPPEVVAHPSAHPRAIQMARQTLFLGVHGGVRMSQLRRLLPPTMPADGFQIVAGADTDADRFVRSALGTSLPQSAAYAQAVADTNRGTSQRYAITHRGSVIGVAQAVERRFCGFRVTRINRGPVWSDGLTADDKHRAISALTTHFGGPLHMLLLAPNLEADVKNLDHISRLGFARRKASPYQSIVLDLTKDEDVLRAGLSKTWRNQLKAGMTKIAEIEVGSNPNVFEWFLERQREMAEARQFAGPALDTLRRFQQLSPNDIVIVRARADGSWIGGVAILRHGAGCTYALGWNAAEGRQLNSGNVLLWRAIVEMKRLGSKWIDLGGLSDFKASGIAGFKRGLGGREYRLAGEFRRWAPGRR